MGLPEGLGLEAPTMHVQELILWLQGFNPVNQPLDGLLAGLGGVPIRVPGHVPDDHTLLAKHVDHVVDFTVEVPQVVQGDGGFTFASKLFFFAGLNTSLGGFGKDRKAETHGGQEHIGGHRLVQGGVGVELVLGHEPRLQLQVGERRVAKVATIHYGMPTTLQRVPLGMEVHPVPQRQQVALHCE